MLDKLHIKAEDLVRKEEKLYKDEYRDRELSEEEWINVLADNPKLIQRPVVVNGKRAIIGRPPESVHILLQ
jgi:arsenate reductase